MAISPPRSHCEILDLPSGTVLAASNDAIAFDWLLEPDKASDGWAEFPSNSPIAQEAVIQVGGSPPNGLTGQCILTISLDGGASVDFRLIVETVEQDMTVVIRGRCLFGGYADNAVDRLTLNQVTLAQALAAAPGTIKAVPAPRGKDVIRYAFAGINLPAQKGLFQTTPGQANWLGKSNYAMPVSVSPKIAGLRVDGDSNTNFIDRAATQFIALTIGIPLDGTPLGSYSHFVADTSDATLNLTGQKQGIAIGYLGTSPFLTFARNPAPSDTSSALIIEPPTGLKLTSALGRPAAKITAIGGYTNHGLPEGARIVDGITINTAHPNTSVAWGDSLYVFVAVDSSGLGGAYYWPHDGQAYRIGQEIDGASSIAYDPLTHRLYVSGHHGVFYRTATVGTQADWTRLGGLNAIIREVRVEAGGRISCWADKNPGAAADGLYIYPALVGAPTGAGYDGWSVLDSNGPLIGYHYDGGAPNGGALTVVYQDNPTQYLHIDDCGAPAPIFGPATTVSPTLAHVEGMDDLGGNGVALRTAAGADGLYRYGSTGIVDLNADGSLLDRYGAPVRVNRVQLATNSLYINDAAGVVATQAAALICSTDAGLYVSASINGGGWVAMPQQSGIGDQNVTGTAIGAPQTLAGGRITTRVYCATQAGLYISHSAGIYFDADGVDKLGIGAYFTALARLAGVGLFPDNDISVIQVLPATKTTRAVPPASAPLATGTSGRMLTVYLPPASAGQPTSTQQLTPGVYWLRPLDERNHYTYRLHDTLSGSPTARMLPAEFTTIQSDSATPAATASGKLAQAIVRKWMDLATVPHQVTIPSILADTGNKLRRLRPSHQVAAIYDATPNYTVKLTGMVFYVTAVHVYKARADTQVHVDATLSTVFRSADPTDQQLGDALSEAFAAHARGGRSH